MIRIKKVGNNLGLAGISVANIVKEGKKMMIRIKKVGNNLGLAGISVANIVEEGGEEKDDDQDQEGREQPGVGWGLCC